MNIIILRQGTNGDKPVGPAFIQLDKQSETGHAADPALKGRAGFGGEERGGEAVDGIALGLG